MSGAIKITSLRTPPGPAEKYTSAEDLFLWMNENFVRYGDIYKASVFGSEVFVVSSPQYCEHILRWNWRNYARSGQVVKRIALLLGNGLIASNGDFWAKQRRLIQPAFSKFAISDYIGGIARANAELLEMWKQAAERREPVNVTQDVSRMVLEITLVAIFGDDAPAMAPYFKILADTSERNLEFAQSFRPLGKNVLEIAARRRRNGTTITDILGRMMQTRDRERDEPMSDAQLAKEVMTLLVAGHETTASLLNWIWYLLSRHPDVQARLASELDRLPWRGVPAMAALPRYTYTRQVIDEALRLYPPLWLMTRRALAADRLGDFFVPARTEIYISPYLIQRNPALWEAPDRFDPDRLNPDSGEDRHELSLCPFGAGPRNCIGEAFARIETQVHLMMFARELCLHLEGDRPPEITTGMNLLSKHDFMMIPQIRGRVGC